MVFLYPQGKNKALTFSYDDGQKFDRQLVGILNQYGMKGTFHLNSGRLADHLQDVFVGRDEISTLYAGHEISCHGVEHKNLTLLSRQGMLRELEDDRRELEALSGKIVSGMSYAYGSYSPEVEEVAKTVGIKYSRTVNATGYFGVPVNFLEWHPTCHHLWRLMELGENFLHTAEWEELPLMYVWGHSYEFDRDQNWNLLEEFCGKMSGREDIWYATNMEICDYVTATRRLEYSMDGRSVFNPTAATIWMQDGDKVLTLEPGGTIRW